MDKLIRFLSGEVPGGFFLYFTIIAVLLFFYGFLLRYSEVINKKKLSRAAFALIGLIILSYTMVRLARPPKLENIYFGILPLEMKKTPGSDTSGSKEAGKYSGTGWIIAEMASRNGQLASRSHINFLRPEWLTDSFDGDSAGKVSYTDPSKLLSWAHVIRLNYLAAGWFEVRDKDIEINVDIYETESNQAVQHLHESFTKSPNKSLIEHLAVFSSELTKKLYALADEAYPDFPTGGETYRTPALFEYARGRSLLSDGFLDSSLTVFRNALRSDSGSVLAWYGVGLAHGEIMIRTHDQTLRENHQKRAEIYLKKAGQLDSLYEPVYSALAIYYMFAKPEPHYLQAEYALMAAYDLYDRDYLIYHILSYMQKMRWETFNFKSKEDILRKAIEVNPAGFMSYLALAQSYLQRSRPHDATAQWALNNFSTALKLRPNDLDAMLGMVVALDYISYYDQAIDLLKKAERLYPENAELHYNAGVVHFHLAGLHRAKRKKKEEFEEYKLAEPHFKKAIAINNHHYSYIYLGRIYDVTDRKNEAIEAFRACMRLFDKEDPYREEARKKLRGFFPNVD